MADLKLRVGNRVVDIRQTLLDRAITYFDPVRGQRRFAARGALALAGGYNGGRRDKRGLSSWTPLGNSADSDLLPDLPTLRQRSRDLVRNAPLAAGALNTVSTNVVGTGLMLKSRVDREALGWDEEQAAAWQRDTEREWRMWAETTACDVTRTQNFYGLQDLALRSSLENGDVLALLPFVPRAGSAYDLRIQLVEADRVGNKDNARDTPQLAGGVALDAYGAPVGYHIMDQHPGDLLVTKRTWKIYQAFGNRTGRRNVLHLYSKRRVGQTRGAPYFAPVIEVFKQLDRYSEAEVFAAVASAMFAIVTKTDDRGGLSPLESAVTGQTPTSGASDTAKGSSWDGTLSAGLAVDLGKNESVEAFAPGRPNPQFDPFMQAVLRQVGVALELPFEVLVKHFTASYSAARAALLDLWKFVKVRRNGFADMFCQPVYEAWMEEAVASGRRDAPGFFDDPLLRAAYLGSEWHGDGPGAIDPLKEANAIEKRLGINLTTLEGEMAEYNGGDFESVIGQRARERKKLNDAGLSAPAAAPAPADPSADPNADPNANDAADAGTRGVQT